MEHLSDYTRIIEKAIADKPYTGNPQNLYDPVNYILSLGGKRIRPVLALMGYEMIAGTIEQSAVQTALAMEVFHNFTLMHDDIMDKAPLRRGKPTVHHKWNETIAILSGDAMLIKSYELLGNHKPEVLAKVLPLFNRTALEVCEGQQMDMNFENAESVSVAEYLRMITLKTAVLLGCSLSAGAITAGATEEQARHLYAYGKHIGIAFQLMDDWLDLFGDAAKTGKQNGGDVLAGKKTYLYTRAMEKADEATSEQLKQLYLDRHMAETEKIAAVKAIYEQLDIGGEIAQRMHDEQQVAEKHLEQSGIEAETLRPLRSLTAFLQQREQ